MRTPGTYNSLLEELATGTKSLADMATALGRRTPDIQGYLRTLRDMRIVERSAPVTVRDDARNHRYRLADDFMRFWFRFEHRKTGTRQTEELDIVGLRRGSVALVGECKWTTDALGPNVLADLETFKLPAMRQAGIRFAAGGPTIVLFSKTGFKPSLRRAIEPRHDVTLISADELVTDLTATEEAITRTGRRT